MSTSIDVTDKLLTLIQEAKQPENIEVDGRPFVTRQVFEAPLPEQPKALGVSTLSAVADYINNQQDYGDEDDAPFLVQVKSHTEVAVRGWFDKWKRRETVLTASAIIGSFKFGEFTAIEWFTILLQTQFAETEQLLQIISAVSRLTDQTIVKFEDDGVTQVVSGTVGIVREGTIPLPRIVELRPYSTFRDVDAQPDRTFLLRLKKGRGEGDSPQAALFEADGGMWQLRAIEFIKSYLDINIESGKAIIIG